MDIIFKNLPPGKIFLGRVLHSSLDIFGHKIIGIVSVDCDNEPISLTVIWSENGFYPVGDYWRDIHRITSVMIEDYQEINL